MEVADDDSLALLQQASLGGGDLTPECRDEWGPPVCLGALYDACIAAGGGACTAELAVTGFAEACVEAAFESGCRRDHGWYPETEASAWPWLDACLAD